MKPANDRALNTKMTPGLRRDAHRPGAALVGVLAAALLTLLPNAAQADHGFTGTNRVATAEISVTPDGYEATGSFFRQEAVVSGQEFGDGNLVQIFLCPAGVAPNHVLTRCQQLTTVLAESDGTFEIEVVYSNMFVSEEKLLSVPDPNRPANFCRGFADWHIQCSIVAASFGFNPVTLSVEPIEMAEHYVCYEGGYHFENCVDPPA